MFFLLNIKISAIKINCGYREVILSLEIILKSPILFKIILNSSNLLLVSKDATELVYMAWVADRQVKAMLYATLAVS